MSRRLGIGLVVTALACVGFVVAIVLVLAATPKWHGWPADSNGPRSGWTAMSAGDTDGDGTPDVLLRTTSEDIPGVTTCVARVISGKTHASRIVAPSELCPEVSYWVPSGAGDVNGDGRDDLFSERDGHPIVIDVASGRMLLSLSSEDYELHEPVGDVDGDGGCDLLVCGHPSAPRSRGFFGRIALPRNLSLVSGKTGVALWTLEVKSDRNGDARRTMADHGCACGDVNRDGVRDVVISTETDRLRVLSGRDGMTLRELDFDCRDVGGQLACAGDLDRDGSDDLLVRAGPGAPIEVVNPGTGKLLYAIPCTPDAEFLRVFTIDDEDDDGVRDIAISWYRLRVHSGVDGHLLREQSEDGFSGGTADFDGDGRADLLVTRNVSGDEAEQLGDDVWRAGRVEVLSGRDRSLLFTIDGDDLTPIRR